MIVGYGRTSTLEQVAGLDAQRRDLEAAGCDKLFMEQISGKDDNRPQLTAGLDYVRDGDVFVVTKLDRLARSVADLMRIVDKLAAKGVELRILAMNLDTSTATGKLMLGVLGSVAQFERELMIERQKVGIEAARAAGRYKGRAPTARAKADQVHVLKAGGMGCAEIARELKIGRASVYRVLGDAAIAAE